MVLHNGLRPISTGVKPQSAPSEWSANRKRSEQRPLTLALLLDGPSFTRNPDPAKPDRERKRLFSTVDFDGWGIVCRRCKHRK
jgi:hypothetical protein